MNDVMVKIYYVSELDTLDVWFGEIGKQAESEEAGDGVILKLGRNRDILGVEIIGLSKTTKEDLSGLPSDVRKTVLDVTKKLNLATAGLS
jgi:uncharacterized protein YuzE